jgi:hypothetical protein
MTTEEIVVGSADSPTSDESLDLLHATSARSICAGKHVLLGLIHTLPEPKGRRQQTPAEPNGRPGNEGANPR